MSSVVTNWRAAPKPTSRGRGCTYDVRLRGSGPGEAAAGSRSSARQSAPGWCARRGRARGAVTRRRAGEDDDAGRTDDAWRRARRRGEGAGRRRRDAAGRGARTGRSATRRRGASTSERVAAAAPERRRGRGQTGRPPYRAAAPSACRYNPPAAHLVPPSSSGLGHRPFKPAARIRIPLGAPHFSPANSRFLPSLYSVGLRARSGRGWRTRPRRASCRASSLRRPGERELTGTRGGFGGEGA